MQPASRFITTFGRMIEGMLAEKSKQLGRKVTLNELCFRANVDVSNVWRSMYTPEREGRPPSPRILKKISGHLPISLTDLLKRTGHAEIADAVAEESELEAKIDGDPTLAPELKAKLKSYLVFLRGERKRAGLTGT